jgi:hypothetical protein
MKTIYEWLNELPQPYKSQALYNFEGYVYREDKQYLKHNTYEYMCEAINHSMHWASTVQGHDYWEPLYKEYEKIKEADREAREEREREEERRRTEERLAKKVIYSDSMFNMLVQLQSNSQVARNLCNINCWDNSFANYVTMRGDMCSYLPAGREHRTNPDTGRWLRDGRQDMKPAKLARKLLNEYGLSDLCDADFEKFNNLVRAYISVEGDEDGIGRNVTLEVISGEAIKDAYHEDNYSRIQGTSSNLWNSCMRYEGCQDYFGIYTLNPDKVSMLVAYDCDRKILGRAILWNFNDNTKGMDTIYASDSIKELFIRWAIDNKYYYKASQSCHHQYFDRYDGEMTDFKFKCVTLTNHKLKKYPYMDTMQYLSNYGLLSNDYDVSYDYTLRCTGGGYDEEDDDYVTDINGERLHNDDARWIDYTRPSGRNIEGYVHCDCVSYCQDGEYYLDDDTVYINGDNYFINDENVVLTYNDDHALREDCVYLDAGDYAGEYAPSDECVALANGEWVLEDEAQQCCVDDEYYLLEDIEEIDGNWVATCNKEQYLENLKETENA